MGLRAWPRLLLSLLLLLPLPLFRALLLALLPALLPTLLLALRLLLHWLAVLHLWALALPLATHLLLLPTGMVNSFAGKHHVATVVCASRLRSLNLLRIPHLRSRAPRASQRNRGRWVPESAGDLAPAVDCMLA